MVDTGYILVVLPGRIGGGLRGKLGVGQRLGGGSCVHGSSGGCCIGASGRGRVVSAIRTIGYSMRFFSSARLWGRFLGGCGFGEDGGGRVHFAGAVCVLVPLLLQ